MSAQTISVDPVGIRLGSWGRASLPMVGVCAWVLTVAAIAVSAALGGVIPSPYAETTTVANHFTDHRAAALASSLVTFVSAVPIMVFGGMLAHELRRVGPASSAHRLVASAGTSAGVVVAAAAGGTWMLTRPEGTSDPATVHLVADGVFVLGGPVFAQLLGVMCLAVSATLTGVIARPMTIAGLVIGTAGIAGALGLLWPPLLFLMPIARFGGLGWLTATAVVLTRTDSQASA